MKGEVGRGRDDAYVVFIEVSDGSVYVQGGRDQDECVFVAVLPVIKGCFFSGVARWVELLYAGKAVCPLGD